MSDHTTTLMADKQQVIGLTANKPATIQYWLCDVCKLRKFSDYDEALAHETNCQGVATRVGGSSPQSSSSSLDNGPCVFLPSNGSSNASRGGRKRRGAQTVSRRPPSRRNPTTTVAVDSFFTPRCSGGSSNSSSSSSTIIDVGGGATAFSGGKTTTTTQKHGGQGDEEEQQQHEKNENENDERNNNPFFFAKQRKRGVTQQQLLSSSSSSSSSAVSGGPSKSIGDPATKDGGEPRVTTTTTADDDSAMSTTAHKTQSKGGLQQKKATTKRKKTAPTLSGGDFINYCASSSDDDQTTGNNNKRAKEEDSATATTERTKRSRQTTKAAPAAETTKPDETKAAAAATTTTTKKKQPPPRGGRRPPLAATDAAVASTRRNNRPVPTASHQLLAEMITNDVKASPQLASIFKNMSSQQILAEQRQAELQARQDSERSREKERQAKRALIFGSGGNNNNGGKGSSETKVVVTTKGMQRKCPIDGGRRHNDDDDAVTNTNNDSHATTTDGGGGQRAAVLPLAPRFPIPNHVFRTKDDSTGNDDDDDDRTSSSAANDAAALLPDNHPFARNRTINSKGRLIGAMRDDSRVTTCTTSDPVRKWLSSPCALDGNNDGPPPRTVVQQVLSELIVPKTTSSSATTTAPADDHHNASHPDRTDHLLWSEKHGMSHGLVGAANQQTFHQLVEYLNHWRVARKESLDRMAERQRKLQGKRKQRKSLPKPKKKRGGKGYEDNSDSDDDWLCNDDRDEDYDLDDDPDKMATLCLLTGLPGSGKTALVHHVAKHCHCSVLEINTSRLRSGAALKHAIEEATQSCSSLEMLKMKNDATSLLQGRNGNSFFGKAVQSRNDVEDSDDRRKYRTEERDTNKPSLTIVLIDEVDILFDNEGDAGFWTALASLSKTAKCPIILTANNRPEQLRNNGILPHRHLETQRPTSIECATKLLQIFEHEGIQIQPKIRAQGQEVIHEVLSFIATLCDCDLRKMMLELQVLSCRMTKQPPILKGAFGKIKDRKEGVESSQPSSARKSNDWRPTVDSLLPSKVPIDEYSIIRVKGRNFGTLRASLGTKGMNREATDADNDSAGFSVWIGDQKCRTRLVDDETLAVLCPPHPNKWEDSTSFCSRLLTRVVPLAIECPSLGMYKASTSRVVKIEPLVNGRATSGAHWLTVEYEYPGECSVEETDRTKAGIEEWEMEIEEHQSRTQDLVKEISNANLEIEGEGKVPTVWGKSHIKSDSPTVSNVETSSVFECTQNDVNVVALLETCALDARNMSDAAILEDFQQGLPFLAGACKGFAFDCTEESTRKVDGTVLRIHDNSRPPREQKLFESGWKDDCYFYGDPETYMTFPSALKDRRQLNHMMGSLRGTTSVDRNVTISPPYLDHSDIETREDLDRFANQQACVFEEDCFLPFQVPPVILCLPYMLRNISMQGACQDSLDSLMLCRKKAELSKKAEWLADFILPPLSGRANWSYGRFGQHRFGERFQPTDCRTMLELMPFLRRIAVLEQADEYAALDGGCTEIVSSNRRTTRRQAKARRHHYFDKISVKLRRDEADLNSSELGTMLADMLITYSIREP